MSFGFVNALDENGDQLGGFLQENLELLEKDLALAYTPDQDSVEDRHCNFIC